MPAVVTCLGILLFVGYVSKLCASGFYAYLAWFDPERYRGMVEPVLPSSSSIITRLLPYKLMSAPWFGRLLMTFTFIFLVLVGAAAIYLAIAFGWL